nr:tyrosine N-monooxygenase [Echinochloa crus-galli var. zelayensis]
MHHMISNKPVFRWIHRLLKEMNTNILCLRVGAVHVIVVACPELARDNLRKNDAAFASRPITFASGSFSFGYKGSILSPYGAQWKKMRRVLTSEVLSAPMERRLQSRRAEEADHLIRFVYNQCNTSSPANSSTVVDVRHVAQHFCGNMIRRLMFGQRHFVEPVPFSAPAGTGPGPEEVAHVGALFTLLNYVYSFSISDYIPEWIGLDLDGHKKVAKDVMKTLNRLHDPIIDERIHRWSGLRKRGDKRDPRDFLDVLVSLQDSEGQPLLSLDEIKAQTAEIMFAIVDNPSNAVEWAFAEMVNKPEVMKQAINEMNTVVGKERLVQESDIPRLNYLKACIREAFRLHPYHAFNPPHVAMEDTIVSGYFIPKDSHVLVSRVGLGRNPDIWEAPLEFRPERHMKNNSDVALTEPDLRFISFSTGRRGCPGVSLGSSVTMMLFARLLQGFTWSKPTGVHAIELKESTSTSTLALAEPLLLHAQPRLPVHLSASI